MKHLLISLSLFFSAAAIQAQSCNLYLTTLDSLPNGSIWITAHMSGTTPSYLWSNGSTDATIEIFSPGTYTVFATNAEGCTLEGSYQAECRTRVRQEGVCLKAYQLLGGTGLDYVWHTGAVGQTFCPVDYGSYEVTVTGNNACGGMGSIAYGNFMPASNCSASITLNSDNSLTANATGVPPFTYDWVPTYLATQTIDPGLEGTYCVTITDATGCTSSACQFLFDPTFCQVNITVHPDSSAEGGWLTAQTSWQFWNDWQFEWNTGETSPTIYVNSGGNYCVTITGTQMNCNAVNCFTFWPDSSCYAKIELESYGINDAFLTVTGGPTSLVDYQWDNGGTAATKQTTTPGWHSVTVTNSDGCVASASYYLNEYNLFRLSVLATVPDTTILTNNSPMQARAFLIKYDPDQGGILTAVDTIETNNWWNSYTIGEFYDVEPGEYLLKVALLPTSNGYSEHLPTYFEQSLFWSQATPVTFSAFGGPVWQQAIVKLLQGQNPGGPGFVGGLVSQGANIYGGGGQEFSGNGDPMAGVTVILTLADGTPVAVTVTDANGQYSFANLAWGTYQVTIDIPGIPLVSIEVVIGPDSPTAANVNFKIDEDSIAVAVNEAWAKSSIAVFPNPTKDEIFVAAPEMAEIRLSDALGNVVLSAKGTNANTRLSLGSLASGIYFLNVRSANTTEIVKLIKE